MRGRREEKRAGWGARLFAEGGGHEDAVDAGGDRRRAQEGAQPDLLQIALDFVVRVHLSAAGADWEQMDKGGLGKLSNTNTNRKNDLAD